MVEHIPLCKLGCLFVANTVFFKQEIRNLLTQTNYLIAPFFLGCRSSSTKYFMFRYFKLTFFLFYFF